MQVVLLLAWLAQASGCGADEISAMADAGRRVRSFDLGGAVERLEGTASGCETTRIALLYLRGLQAARAAYPNGGDDVSLMPVTQAIAGLETYAATNPRAELARVTLMAAAAAAQSERSDMALLLEQAATLEEKMAATSGTGAPGVTAHEVAGDLWLQVHRFEMARSAYERASQLFGVTPRIAVGLARTAVQLHDDARACDAYRWVVTQWTASAAPPDVLEAREFVASARCGAGAGR